MCSRDAHPRPFDPSAVVLYGRYPVRGKTKTRLAASLGEEGTLQLYRSFLADTAAKLGAVECEGHVAVLAYDGASVAVPADPLGRNPFDRFTVMAQEGADFGARLSSSMRRVLEMGFRRVVLVGADSPEMERTDLEDALELLRTKDVVFGPADDGGYYLVGMSRFSDAIFTGINWSTPTVLQESLDAAARAGLGAGLVARRADVDLQADLEALARRRRAGLLPNGPCSATDAWIRKWWPQLGPLRSPGGGRLPASGEGEKGGVASPACGGVPGKAGGGGLQPGSVDHRGEGEKGGVASPACGGVPGKAGGGGLQPCSVDHRGEGEKGGVASPACGGVPQASPAGRGYEADALSSTVAIIPVWNEEVGIGPTLDDLPKGIVPIVVDNGSTDRTVEIAKSKGAHVIHEKEHGYGVVLAAGIRAIPRIAPEARYVTFVDGDHADHTEEIPGMLAPVAEGLCDMVIGSRVAGKREPGALPAQSRFAIWYARLLLWRLYRIRCTDIGPLRVLPLGLLRMLDMKDRSWGWTVEMQAKAARLNLRVVEVPTRYRKRPGHSKISGAFKTAVKAGWKILVTVIKWRFAKFPAS